MCVCFKTNNRVVRVSEAEGYLDGLICAKECYKNHTTQQISHKRFIGGEGIQKLSEQGWRRKERERQNKRMVHDGRDLLKGTHIWWTPFKRHMC